jgi:two-component system, sensor histidine kinase YesM
MMHNLKKLSVDFKNISLKHRLIISYLASILIPLLIFGGILYVVSINELQAEMRKVSFQTVKQINKTFDEYLNQIDTISLMPYTDSNVEDYLLNTSGIKKNMEKYVLTSSGLKFNTKRPSNPNMENVEMFLQNLVNVKQDIDFASLISLNGEIVTKSRFGIVKPQFDFFNDSYYEKLRKSTGEKTITPIHNADYLFAPRINVFSVGRRILNFDEGAYTGYILIDCNIAVFERILTGINIGKFGYVLIVGKDGNLLYNSSKDHNDSMVKGVLSKLKGRKDVNTIENISSNKEIIVSSTSEYSGWTAIGILPYKEVVQRVEGIRIIFFSLAVISFILVLGCSILISNGVARPMKNLQNAMKAVESGNTAIRVSINSYNEIGELSQSFNQLVQKINILLASIKSIEIKKREAELEALKSQINPHFLYNTLESIRMMAVIDDKMEIASAAEALANLFRYNIKHKKDIVNVKDELQHAKNYIHLQKIRYEDKFDFCLDIDDEVLSYKTLKFTLQPIIENAIYHGIEKKKGKGIIKISAHKIGGNLVFEIRDDGVGIPQDKLMEFKEYLKGYGGDDTKSIGLKNVNERVMLYFGRNYGLFIESTYGEGTSVRLVIPAFEDEKWVIDNVISISGR